MVTGAAWNRVRIEPPERTGESGQVTLFGVGLILVMLVVSGFSIDLWHVFSERRALAEVADAAVAAGANGVDQESYRSGGELVLDEALAADLAWDSLAGQPDQGSLVEVVAVNAEPDRIEVRLMGEVDLMLLDVFSPTGPMRVEVMAEAGPRGSR